MTEPPETLNFAEHLFARNRGRAGKIAYVDDRGTLGLRRARGPRRAGFAAALLGAAACAARSACCCCMLDSNDWPVAFLGCLYAGIVPVAVNTLLTVDDYAYMLGAQPGPGGAGLGALLPTLRRRMARGAERGRRT